ncbi:MAG: hypothetical protein UU73_C0002G0137 [Candidatus Daviesbacteria bacterium GW2011_GWA1_41_61]|uniref:Uncharacterized protein n=1 Tax=Candidatus Daviesbacteria bacterium GW2011_GWA2_40_9 TaxID=1618424 RepID=A0A0G0U6B4_9BACT|nr:MAG: hypothetical protein UU26_C0032G0011 [Candidatus Daviesbacteria bacterium GW2011_GWC1_40_9]KKR82736.1 MAG: hypothetical protein UU29_C0009G0007 [Candidatus Daviesbacteria bacterium GW2011_GWA2_40_9]KKR93797.1 MAG: hypothetical protein UU44_C0001G0137 [Candidatus Daviesbacteria bacterium GW2011_GWB1_41_15]KKS15263.1 MAG: hypothetical protein UU73_C0002G0137 [Candidatus Daviesbacteria bacterium GW2011_GWA1_41_61]
MTENLEGDILKQIAVVGSAASMELKEEQDEVYEELRRNLRIQYLRGVIDTTAYLLKCREGDVAMIETIVGRGRYRYRRSREIVDRYPALGE